MCGLVIIDIIEEAIQVCMIFMIQSLSHIYTYIQMHVRFPHEQLSVF